MREYDDYGYKMIEFNSFSEVAEYLEQIPDLYKYEMTKKSRLSYDSSFFGIDSFDKVLNRLRYGDNRQTETFKNELKDLNSYDELDCGIFRDVEGFAYDMGSVVNGEPECCLNFGSPEAKQSLNIYIDLGYSGCTDAETINNRGYALVKLINTLISKGYILNVYVVRYATISYNGDKYAQLIKVPTEFFSLSIIAYACTCDFYRVVTWLLTAIQMKDKNYTGDSSAKADKKIIEGIKKRGDLYIGGGFTDSRLSSCSKEEAEKIILNYYNEYIERKHKNNG